MAGGACYEFFQKTVGNAVGREPFYSIAGRVASARQTMRSSGTLGNLGKSVGGMADRIPTGGPMALMGLGGAGIGAAGAGAYMYHRHRRGY